MRVGVIELLAAAPPRGAVERVLRFGLVRQYVSIPPQAVAAWARSAGHEVHYAVYYGQRRPERLLPDDLDVAFVACHSRASLVAYALARVLAKRGTVTVLGGPHATAFAEDAARFFDVVVDRCDASTVRRILRDPRGVRGRLSAETAGFDVPPLAARLPEIAKTALVAGRRHKATTLPMLASVGCPYTCDFCVDATKPYVALEPERLGEDLAYAADRWPGVRLAFHDPNFAVRFDETLDVLERVPATRRSPYAMQASLSILKGRRLARLRDTRCVYVAPSLESWSAYSDKAGVGRDTGWSKLARIVDHFREIREHVPGIQVNFILGLDQDDADADEADDSVAMTLAFVDRLPFVLPTATIAMPYGGTELYDRIRGEGRLLESLPPALYYAPHLATVPRLGDPEVVLDRAIRTFAHMTSPAVLRRRWSSDLPVGLRVLHHLRAVDARRMLAALRASRRRFDDDRELLAYHRGRTRTLPGFYRARVHAAIGPYRELFAEDEWVPVHGSTAETLRNEPPGERRGARRGRGPDASRTGRRRAHAPRPASGGLT